MNVGLSVGGIVSVGLAVGNMVLPTNQLVLVISRKHFLHKFIHDFFHTQHMKS